MAAEENLKTGEYNLMVDLKTLVNNSSLEPTLLQLKICINNIKKRPLNSVLFLLNSPNGSIW